MGTGSLIDTFAWKAAALSHMGHVTEARSAAAEFLSVGRTNWSEPEPTDEQIVFWVLQAFPIKDDETRSRLARGLEAAGLPVG